MTEDLHAWWKKINEQMWFKFFGRQKMQRVPGGKDDCSSVLEHTLLIYYNPAYARTALKPTPRGWVASYLLV